MPDESSADQLRAIEQLLDERVGRQGLEDLTLFQRVVDVVAAFDFWSELAIRRLHEIHRLTGDDCESCSKHLDP